jgi:hypothetical protein
MTETQEQTTQESAGCAECACHGLGPMVTDFFKRMGPPESARQHFNQARIEILKGLRALIDARIADISKREEKHGTTVTVE